MKSRNIASKTRKIVIAHNDIANINMLIKAFESTKSKNDLFKIFDEINTKYTFGILIDSIKKTDGKSYSEEVFNHYKKFINPELLLKFVLDNVNSNNFTSMINFLPEKLEDSFIGYYHAKSTIDRIDEKIENMSKELNNFKQYNSKYISGNIIEFFEKAVNIFTDLTKPLKESKEKFINSIGGIEHLKIKLEQDIIDLKKEDLYVLSRANISEGMSSDSTISILYKAKENSNKPSSDFSYFKYEDLTNIKQEFPSGIWMNCSYL